MKKYSLLILLAFLFVQMAFSQKVKSYKWWNPMKSSFPVIHGQAWPNEISEFYDRLPARAKKEVRQGVWKRSQASAGLTIQFYSNASNIRVRYTVSRELSLPHVPATGKSGLDLYSVDKSGKWEWSPGRYNFGTINADTIEYNFNSLKQDFTRKYFLYLPYYNQVTWLTIGIPEKATIKPLPLSKETPIVIYGTSITQGTAAPRPGLTWAAILQRRLHTPVVNLGFAGQGRLETPVINLMAELDAKVYILACLPNLVGGIKIIKSRLTNAIKILQQKRPDVPILIVDHADANVISLNTVQQENFIKTNEASRETFAELKAAGVTNIYYLSADSIGLNYEDVAIDGVHPNASGEEKYAKAYEKIIRMILHEQTVVQ